MLLLLLLLMMMFVAAAAATAATTTLLQLLLFVAALLWFFFITLIISTIAFSPSGRTRAATTGAPARTARAASGAARRRCSAPAPTWPSRESPCDTRTTRSPPPRTGQIQRGHGDLDFLCMDVGRGNRDGKSVCYLNVGKREVPSQILEKSALEAIIVSDWNGMGCGQQKIL